MTMTSRTDGSADQPMMERAVVAIHTLERYGIPLVDLFFRVLIFRAFFNAGLTKISDWDNTLVLFEYEYMVPLLDHVHAAYLATAAELVMSCLILAGLLTRLAAIPLLAMALVIQFVLGATNPAYSNVEHFYWMAILLMLIVRGPGPLSLDRLLRGRLGIG
ncbi:MAG: DoxX family protein [Pseudomonadota bacterium]|nr:DoxX family protein [Pseudomonadota bacterium]